MKGVSFVLTVQLLREVIVISGNLTNFSAVDPFAVDGVISFNVPV